MKLSRRWPKPSCHWKSEVQNYCGLWLPAGGPGKDEGSALNG
jgi:hypothetical protein